MQIFLTGATGFLGGELLVELARKNEVDKIYCLVRAHDDEKAHARIAKVFDLHGDRFDVQKVIPVMGELTDDNLSESLIHNPLLRDVDTVIHSAANTSFTKIYADVVENVNIGGTRQLLLWAKALKSLDVFMYVGTAAICGTTVKNSVVTEDLSPNLAAKHLVKYSYTKMIGELLLKEYLPENKILVVRPSIIMGDSRTWVPRSNVILWAVATLNHMRLIPGDPHSNIDIIPIDYATKAIIKLLFNKHRHHNVYHISSGQASATNPEKITMAMKDSFPEKPKFRFVSKNLLVNMKKWSKNGTTLDEHNPLQEHQEYLDYWIDYFGDNSKLRILFYALEPYINFIELGQIFDNRRLVEDTQIEPSTPAHEYITTSARHFDAINIFEGAIDP
jgi:thioester reductase-like protein